MIRVFDFEKLPIVDVVNEILIDAVHKNASDIHLEPLEDYLRIRIRIDGELIEYTRIPSTVTKNLTTRIKIMADMNITETRLPQDGAIKNVIKDESIDMRVSSLPTQYGEKIVIRVMDFSINESKIDSLGFTNDNLKKLAKMASMPNGIILVTGATGSGKSTTVYSVLRQLNKETVNIITVEDPVEMAIDGINQVQVNSDIGLDFANVLRSVLRQDPDVIMIGEIRDDETARIAVRAAITGHLVLSTIHTNNSLSTIERLIDMDVERYLLAAALAGIISQKLVRKLCPNCKTIKQANDYEKKVFNNFLGEDISEIHSPVGCDYCNDGYRGRIALHEVLLINQHIRDIIGTDTKKDDIRKQVYTSDIKTLLQDGLIKVKEGQTSLEEVLKAVKLEDD